jgi:hypothetical protein
MTIDSSIAIGDVVVDLAQGSLMQVVGYEGRVEQHAESEGYDLAEYACHPLFDVQPDEMVWTCVYLGSSLKSLPDASYDSPASRLARVPVEEAREEIPRVQRTIKKDYEHYREGRGEPVVEPERQSPEDDEVTNDD